MLQCFILKGRVRLPCEVCSLLGCKTHTEASGTPSLPVVGETQGNGKPDKEVNLEASNDSPPVTTVGLGPGVVSQLKNLDARLQGQLSW